MQARQELHVDGEMPSTPLVETSVHFNELGVPNVAGPHRVFRGPLRGDRLVLTEENVHQVTCRGLDAVLRLGWGTDGRWTVLKIEQRND